MATGKVQKHGVEPQTRATAYLVDDGFVFDAFRTRGKFESVDCLVNAAAGRGDAAYDRNLGIPFQRALKNLFQAHHMTMNPSACRDTKHTMKHLPS